MHILSPFWLSSLENLEADFLSRQALLAWDFQLSHRIFQQICCLFWVKPTLDAFATSRTNLLPRYMTWERDESAVGQNCLNYFWDPVTWLFPPVPLIPAVLREVEEQQIEAILICQGWKRVLWWPHLSKGWRKNQLANFIFYFSTNNEYDILVAGFLENSKVNHISTVHTIIKSLKKIVGIVQF